MSERSKAQCWTDFSSGKIRIICATDAAGMGVVFPMSSFQLSLGFLPRCQFSFNNGAKEANGDTKANNIKRAKLDPDLEGFINVAADEAIPCSHNEDMRVETLGQCSKVSAFELSWTVLDVAKHPPHECCCSHCNPDLATAYSPADEHNPCLFKYAADFFHPLACPPAPPPPPLSPSKHFTPFPSDFELDSEDKEKLWGIIVKWHNDCYAARAHPLSSCLWILPPKQLDTLIKHSACFLKFLLMNTELILAAVKWDTVQKEDLESLVLVLDTWRRTVSQLLPTTPQSHRRESKHAKISLPSSIFTLPTIVRTIREDGSRQSVILYCRSGSAMPSAGWIWLPANQNASPTPNPKSKTPAKAACRSTATASTKSSKAKVHTPAHKPSTIPLTTGSSNIHIPALTTTRSLQSMQTPSNYSPYYWDSSTDIF
ncbi:hypothetical protein BT96DRAFT_986784 [Gymnopus androsaceus JB14]|uniref:Uncharacterized protein n=1 Tax=Gymnopus androsaceus JB14 TaxID=1447944 RepID=A0A6A4IEI6_9AGAR|nr:hypothetical protein BT96DRAFT_986784 [Gymnopus androsaceus JB14]